VRGPPKKISIIGGREESSRIRKEEDVDASLEIRETIMWGALSETRLEAVQP